MVTNKFKNINPAQPTRQHVACTYPRGAWGFLFGAWIYFNVLNVILKLFPIAPHFYPICFAKSCPLFTYAAGPKGLALHLPIKKIYFYFEKHPKFQFFFTHKKEIRKKELENTLEIIGNIPQNVGDLMKTTNNTKALM